MLAIDSDVSVERVRRQVVERREVLASKHVVKVRVSADAYTGYFGPDDDKTGYFVLKPLMIVGGSLSQYLHGDELEQYRGTRISATVTIMWRKFDDGVEQYYLDFRPIAAVPNKRLAVMSDPVGQWARDAKRQGHEVFELPDPFGAAVIFADPECLIVLGPTKQFQQPKEAKEQKASPAALKSKYPIDPQLARLLSDGWYLVSEDETVVNLAKNDGAKKIVHNRPKQKKK